MGDSINWQWYLFHVLGTADFMAQLDADAVGRKAPRVAMRAQCRALVETVESKTKGKVKSPVFVPVIWHDTLMKPRPMSTHAELFMSSVSWIAEPDEFLVKLVEAIAFNKELPPEPVLSTDVDAALKDAQRQRIMDEAVKGVVAAP